MLDKNGAESPGESEPLIETPPTLKGTFRDVYHFIFQAANGDRNTADTFFEDYLEGKLSEDLLSISRGYVSADQAGSSHREIAAARDRPR
jgi:hypothetical protein